MAHEHDDERLATGWPALPLEEFRDTYATLHMLTQIVGKVRLARAPMMNEWWQVPLYLTARGLTTSPIPDGDRTFSIDFDFVDHEIAVRTSDGRSRAIALVPRPVAEVYRDLFAVLDSVGVEVSIRGVPVEVPNRTPFAEDREHASYDPAWASRFFDVARHLDVVFKEFRARFRGKASPVHFFWGTFDLAVTRYSGRRAPPRPGADLITRVAYDEECSSLGFWPGGMGVDEPALYSYAAPEPEGYAETRVEPAAAYYHPDLHEFILPYEAVRSSPDPRATVLAFAESTYEAAARAGKWDRAALEFRPEEVLKKAA